MSHTVRRLRVFLFLACIAAASVALPAHATIQEDSCIYPDVEYPLPCDDDED
jgi:hypothetical protein